MNEQIKTQDPSLVTRRHVFRAMGTDILLVGPDTDLSAVAEAVETVFAREELRFSRFRPESELSRVNASSGEWTKVSAPFQELVRLSMRQAKKTDGLFDPTVLEAMLAIGYDRDFDEIIAGARGALRPPKPCGRWTEVKQKPGSILLPEGVGLDFGGIAKGWTADVAAAEALATGLPWVIVSGGGDLRLAGDLPPVDIGVEDPEDHDTLLARLTLTKGALATSGTLGRAWGDGLHHLIDPRTGVPATTDVVQATVWAPTCVEAEVSAKWALLTGSSAAEMMPCVLVTTDARVIISFDTTGETSV
jgi:FAD:protein FMN transferase